MLTRSSDSLLHHIVSNINTGPTFTSSPIGELKETKTSYRMVGGCIFDQQTYCFQDAFQIITLVGPNVQTGQQ